MAKDLCIYLEKVLFFDAIYKQPLLYKVGGMDEKYMAKSEWVLYRCFIISGDSLFYILK